MITVSSSVTRGVYLIKLVTLLSIINILLARSDVRRITFQSYNTKFFLEDGEIL